MDFHFAAQEEAFRQELRAWLAANLPSDYDPEKFQWEMTAEERFRWHLDWHTKLHCGGWVGLRMSAFAGELLSTHGALALGSFGAIEQGKWARVALGARGMSLAGGTSEVQRNIVGERVLGLPKG
jgi:alkylation response protein AidB-like acyl-CoA dehydrogenase